MEIVEETGELGWKAVDISHETFHLDIPRDNQEYASINLPIHSSFVDIFLMYMPISFIEDVWEFWGPSHWVYGSSNNPATINRGYCDIKAVYTMLAVYIRLCGLQNPTKGNEKNERTLRNVINESLTAIKQSHPDHHFSGETIIETLISRFHIPKELYVQLGKHLEGVIGHCGRSLICDEKLLHFTGESALIRKISSKPDKIGFWFYEAVCMLNAKTPYLLLSRVQDTCANTKTHISCDEILEEWGNIAIRYKIRNCYSNPLLVFDSYYTVNVGRNYLNDHNVNFIGSCNTVRFRGIVAAMKLCKQFVKKPGDTGCIYHPGKHEIFVNHIDPDNEIGNKHVLSNAFSPVLGTRSAENTIPVYDHYKLLFGGCDKFNRNLHKRLYCFKTGGKDKKGSTGHVHKFYMGAILQNVMAVYTQLHPETKDELSFMQMCLELSGELIEYVTTL